MRVQPRAPRRGFAGLPGGRLRVRLQAPPVDGRANAALIAFMADSFAVPRASVVIEQGHTGRDKRVRIRDAPPLDPSIGELLGCT
jgi:uncharacterized protein (TIGR00251 family)